MKTGVVGSGAWGTGLAAALAANGHDVTVYAVAKEEYDDIRLNHRNSKYFPDVALDPKIKATQKIEDLADCELVVLAVPVRAMESVCVQLEGILAAKPVLVNVAKGFYPGTNERMSQVIARCIGEDKRSGVVSLIGPSFAEEVVCGKLTAIDAVSDNEEVAKLVQKAFSNENLRIYTGTDLVGAETAAALKNVMALATGMCDGQQLGSNARAALVTRGLAEITRFGCALGADPRTFLGLTGVGDLILTCTSKQSRNYSAGYRIGKDDSAEGFWNENKYTVEGVLTAKVIHEFAKKIGVEMPITEAIYRVLYEGEKPSVCTGLLMNRRLKAE